MVNVWKIAPGERAFVWEECRDRKCITINWFNIIDLRTIESKEEMKEALIETRQGSGRGVVSIWPFVYEIRKGDIVVANKGLSKIVGIGVIKSDYLPPKHRRNPNTDRDYHLQTRLVDWQITTPVDLAKRFFVPQTVQLLSSSNCEVIKRAYLNSHPELEATVEELFPLRMSESEASHREEEYQQHNGDLRQTVERQIKLRRGQQKFREALRARFSDQCAVTGCKVVDALEAAHISPHKDIRDQDVQNGLLLRADIHTLFDLNLLGINPDGMRIVLHPTLTAAKDYASLAGKTVKVTGKPGPSKQALKQRCQQFCDALGKGK